MDTRRLWKITAGGMLHWIKLINCKKIEYSVIVTSVFKFAETHSETLSRLNQKISLYKQLWWSLCRRPAWSRSPSSRVTPLPGPRVLSTSASPTSRECAGHHLHKISSLYPVIHLCHDQPGLQWLIMKVWGIFILSRDLIMVCINCTLHSIS